LSRQIRHTTRSDLVLLLEQTDPLAQLAVLGGLGRSDAGTVTGINSCLAEPLRQRHRVDPEIGGDLLEGRALRPAAGHLHDIVAELLRVRPGHRDILPGPPVGQARSDVTPTRGSPLGKRVTVDDPTRVVVENTDLMPGRTFGGAWKLA
jgi:hypothetical protein